MAKPKETSRPSNLSQERVQDSSDEDVSPVEKTSLSKKKAQPSASQETKSVKKTPKSSKQNSATPESEEESTNESEEVENGQEDSDNKSVTSSASSSASSQKRTAPTTRDSLPRKKSKTTTSSAVQIAPKPFKAPSGYEPVIVSASDYASEMGPLFDDLSAKQVWHISVPDGVSIESIKELDIEAAMKGEPILSKDGIDYNMHVVDSKNEAVLLPQGSKMHYRQIAKRVDRSFHLQEMSSKPKAKDTTPLIFTATNSGNPKPVRKQPEGLKMRYTPWGAPAIQEPSEHEDVEMRDTLDIPPELEQTTPNTSSKKSKKYNRKSIDGKSPEKEIRSADGHGSAEKKKKKKRRLVDEDVL